MLYKPRYDNEAIDIILTKIFSEGIPYWNSEKSIDEIFDTSYLHEVDRILRKMKKLDLIQYHDNKDLGMFQITDSAIEILNQYGSYLNYISSTLSIRKKEEKKIFFDRILKNGNVVAALCISSLSLILSQCPIGSNTKQQKIEEGIQSIAKELDSLKKSLQQSSLQQSRKLEKDTATNK
jgi:hypothetical protein